MVNTIFSLAKASHNQIILISIVRGINKLMVKSISQASWHTIRQSKP